MAAKKAEMDPVYLETAPLEAEKPEFYLVVFNAFGDYRRGDVITDAKKMQAILSSSHVEYVHKISVQGV